MDPKRAPLWSTLLFAACLVITCTDLSPVTQTDLELLSSVSEDIICFSRTFHDLTCFWEKKDLQEAQEAYRFSYSYPGRAADECPLTAEELPSGTSLFICMLPPPEVRMFTDLNLKVVNAANQQTLLSRQLSPETVGLPNSPENIHGTWTEKLGTLRVRWVQPQPDYIENVIDIIHEVQYKPSNSLETPQRIITEVNACLLTDLQPGALYDISIRTKPDDSYGGFWGSWSQVVPMATPHNADEIHLDCFTNDLQYVRCEWRRKHEQTAQSSKLYYKNSPTWSLCTDSGHNTSADATTNSCEFLADSRSQILVMVNVTAATGHVTMYLKEPFLMDNAVRSHAPHNLSAQVNDDRLTVTWDAPLGLPEDHLHYEVGYTERNSPDWKVVMIHQAVNNATLDVRFGTQYSVKVRAKPNGQQYSGTWSPWSETLKVTVPSHNGWILFLVPPILLFASAAAFLLLRCTFPAMFSKLKRKIWPPVPNLHRVLDGFLAEIQKQYQPTPSLYEKPTEDTFLPCLLEILSEKTLPPSGDSSALETVVKLSHTATLPRTPVLQRRPQPAASDRPHCPQQDYVVLAPSSVPESRYENDYCNGAVAHSGALGMLLVSVPKKCAYPFDEENRQYTTFTGPWQVDEENPGAGTLRKASDPREQQEWNRAPLNTDIANHSYLLMAGARDWGQ